MKTRKEAIEEYTDALRKENGCFEAAEILYEKLEWLFSQEEISRENKVHCIAEEIDDILCAETRTTD